MAADTWQNIFTQSPVNSGYYDEDELPHCNWDWPKGTWFQARRDIMRERQPAWGHNIRKLQEISCSRSRTNARYRTNVGSIETFKYNQSSTFERN